MENVGKNPGSINDTDFRRRMSEVNESVNVLLNDAREAVGKFVFHERYMSEVNESVDVRLNDAREVIGKVVLHGR